MRCPHNIAMPVTRNQIRVPDSLEFLKDLEIVTLPHRNEDGTVADAQVYIPRSLRQVEMPDDGSVPVRDMFIAIMEGFPELRNWEVYSDKLSPRHQAIMRDFSPGEFMSGDFLLSFVSYMTDAISFHLRRIGHPYTTDHMHVLNSFAATSMSQLKNDSRIRDHRRCSTKWDQKRYVVAVLHSHGNHFSLLIADLERQQAIVVDNTRSCTDEKLVENFIRGLNMTLNVQAPSRRWDIRLTNTVTTNAKQGSNECVLCSAYALILFVFDSPPTLQSNQLRLDRYRKNCRTWCLVHNDALLQDPY